MKACNECYSILSLRVNFMSRKNEFVSAMLSFLCKMLKLILHCKTKFILKEGGADINLDLNINQEVYDVLTRTENESCGALY